MLQLNSLRGNYLHNNAQRKYTIEQDTSKRQSHYIKGNGNTSTLICTIQDIRAKKCHWQTCYGIAEASKGPLGFAYPSFTHQCLVSSWTKLLNSSAPINPLTWPLAIIKTSLFPQNPTTCPSLLSLKFMVPCHSAIAVSCMYVHVHICIFLNDTYSVYTLLLICMFLLTIWHRKTNCCANP